MGLKPTDPRIVIDSDAVTDDGISEPFPTLNFLGSGESGEVPPEFSSGDSIPDAGIGEGGDEADNSRTSASSPKTRRLSAIRGDRSNGTPRDATSKPPSLDEWQNFFGKIVLRVACDWYLNYAFRGIDEEMLTDREIERLALTDDERRLIVTPIAELSSKSKLMRKHGRTIVSSGEAFQSLIVLGAWFSRVNRIAAKYRPRVAQMRVNNGSSGQSASASNATYSEGANGGRVANGFPIYRGSSG